MPNISDERLRLARALGFLREGGGEVRPVQQLSEIFGNVGKGLTSYSEAKNKNIEAMLLGEKADREVQKQASELIPMRDILYPAKIGSTQMPGVAASPEAQTVQDELLKKRTDMGNVNLAQSKSLADIDETKAKADYYRGTGRQPSTNLSLKPAISSGYASREFVTSIFPDLSPDADISVGELQQRLGIKKAEVTANVLKPIASEQIDKISSLRTAIEGAIKIKGDFLKLLSKGESPVDPIGGRFEIFKGELGIQNNPGVVKFQTDVIAQLNTYLNSISGVAISEQEAERLRKRLPGLGMTGEQFIGRLDSFYDELNRSLGSRVKTLKDAGFRTGDLDKFITIDTSVGKPVDEIPPIPPPRPGEKIGKFIFKGGHPGKKENYIEVMDIP